MVYEYSEWCKSIESLGVKAGESTEGTIYPEE